VNVRSAESGVMARWAATRGTKPQDNALPPTESGQAPCAEARGELLVVACVWKAGVAQTGLFF